MNNILAQECPKYCMGHAYTKNDWLCTLKFKFNCASLLYLVTAVSGNHMCEPYLQTRFIIWAALTLK